MVFPIVQLNPKVTKGVSKGFPQARCWMQRQSEVIKTGDRSMMPPFNTDLMKHSAIADTVPTEHEREAMRAQRKFRSAAFRAFIQAFFAQVPRHQDWKRGVLQR